MAANRKLATLAVLSAAAVLVITHSTFAQINEPWVVFVNNDIDFQCDVVNASNAELIVLEDSGEMVLISGADAALPGVFVDDSDAVFLDGSPVGFLELLVDGDGLDAVFWTTLTGTLVGVDTFTGEPFDSGIFPDERISTGCDACDLIDESVFCEDDNGGVVPLPPLCGAGAPALAVLALGLAPGLRLMRRRRNS